jgi:hypothetical protein
VAGDTLLIFTELCTELYPELFTELVGSDDGPGQNVMHYVLPGMGGGQAPIIPPPSWKPPSPLTYFRAFIHLFEKTHTYAVTDVCVGFFK